MFNVQTAFLTEEAVTRFWICENDFQFRRFSAVGLSVAESDVSEFYSQKRKKSAARRKDSSATKCVLERLLVATLPANAFPSM